MKTIYTAKIGSFGKTFASFDRKQLVDHVLKDYKFYDDTDRSNAVSWIESGDPTYDAVWFVSKSDAFDTPMIRFTSSLLIDA